MEANRLRLNSPCHSLCSSLKLKLSGGSIVAVLQQGSTGPAVTALQARLKELGFERWKFFLTDQQHQLAVDYDFGDNTISLKGRTRLISVLLTAQQRFPKNFGGRKRDMNTASQNRLTKVHPRLAKGVTAIIDALAAQGITIEVVQGLRTFAEQDALFAQGRTKPGQVVTQARGGQSNHNYGLAVDLCPFVDGKPQWNDNQVFIRIGAEAVKQGLQWGGDWKKFIDKPHVQIGSLTMALCFSLFK